MTRFKSLFDPINVGGVELKNRIVLLGMGLSYAENYGVTDRLKNFFVERAKGGVGLIIVGSVLPADFRSKKSVFTDSISHLVICSDELIPKLREMTKVIHDNGAKVAAQLILHYEWTKGKDAPVEVVGPSCIPIHRGIPQPRELTISEIQQIVEEFGEGARRARDAGFDMVEFQAGMGYLINRFLSSYSNKRSDRYGGTVENRMQFLLEIVDSAKKKAGGDCPFICRLSADEFMEGGNTIEDTKQVVRTLEKAGIAAIDVEAGWHESPIPLIQQSVRPGAFVYLAEEVKRVVSIPVIATVRMNNPVLANESIAKGRADLVGMARALIADPELPQKSKEGRLKDICYCICCCRCLDDELARKPVTCSVNPRVGKEEERTVKPALKSKRVLIVGGGPAGMEAAQVAFQRGHKVTLLEKERRLGGSMIFGAIINKEIENLLKYMENQIKRLPITVKLRTEITPALVEKINPEVIVLALGGSPITLAIPGINNDIVFSMEDFHGVMNGHPSQKGGIGRKLLWQLSSVFLRFFYSPYMIRWLLRFNFPIGEQVVVIGGGFAGCEIGEVLGEKKKRVTILEESDRVGADIGMSTRWVTKNRLKTFGVRTETNARITEITNKGVRFDHMGSAKFFEADTILLAKGVRSNDVLAKELKDKASVIYYSIGDCAEPGKIREAIESGFRTGVEM